MKPYCSRCGATDPSPIQDEDDLVYWFKMESDEDGEDVLFQDTADAANGDRRIALTGMTMKDFMYDGSYELVCPQCAKEACPFLADRPDVLDEEGWLPDDYDPFEGVEEDEGGSFD